MSKPRKNHFYLCTCEVQESLGYTNDNNFINTLYHRPSSMQFMLYHVIFIKDQIYQCKMDGYLIDAHGMSRVISKNQEANFTEIYFGLEPITQNFIKKWKRYGLQFEFVPYCMSSNNEHPLLIQCTCTGVNFETKMMLPLLGDQRRMVHSAFKHIQSSFKSSQLLISSIRKCYNHQLSLYNSDWDLSSHITLKKIKKRHYDTFR